MKTQMKRMFTVALMVASLLCFGSLTYAQQVEEGAWSWKLVPFYGWFTYLDGDIGIGNQGGSVDIDADEVFENLEFVYMGHFEGVWNQTAGFFMDGIYTKLEAEKENHGVNTKVEMTLPIAEGGVFYRFASGAHAFDLLAGVRYYKLEMDVEVGDFADANTSKDWFDAIGGARWQVRLLEQLSLIARGDLGFGGSNLAWNVAGYLDWQPWEHFSFIGGYRAMDVDYEDEDGAAEFTYDMLIQGPVLGFSIIW